MEDWALEERVKVWNLRERIQNYFNMYNESKSRIKSSYECSNPFSYTISVRQGENLSPFLFALLSNDLEKFLSLYNVSGYHAS
jgi:hypothetical protein